MCKIKYSILSTPCGRGALWEWEGTSVGCGVLYLRVRPALGVKLPCDASCRRWGSPTPTKVKNLLPPEPPQVSSEATAWGQSMGARNPHLCILLLRDVKSEIIRIILEGIDNINLWHRQCPLLPHGFHKFFNVLNLSSQSLIVKIQLITNHKLQYFSKRILFH